MYYWDVAVVERLQVSVDVSVVVRRMYYWDDAEAYEYLVAACFSSC